ncbi:hypothetical protein UlMin_035740 [Ulmus minor]
MGGRRFYKQDGLNKGAWTAQEDQLLIDYVKLHGQGNWGRISKQTGLKRCGKSCRLRWLNYLRPDIKRGNITKDEEDLIIRLHKLLPNRWSLIAGRLPGRTDNEIKNYWNSTLRKKVQGKSKKEKNTTPTSCVSGTKTTLESWSGEAQTTNISKFDHFVCFDPASPFPREDDSFLKLIMEGDAVQLPLSEFLQYGDGDHLCESCYLSNMNIGCGVACGTSNVSFQSVSEDEQQLLNSLWSSW